MFLRISGPRLEPPTLIVRDTFESSTVYPEQERMRIQTLSLKPDWPESEVDNGDDRDDRSRNEATNADEIGDEIDLPYSEAIACGVDPSYKARMRGFHYSKS